ncbi:MAG: cysteine peptidase family C39 domain-containing protein [Cyanobacteria bacterium P01_F01_bin.150]
MKFITMAPLLLIFLSVFGVWVGFWSGHVLAQRGVTADNALLKHQRQVYRWGAIAIAIALIFVIVMTTGKQSPWIPSFLLLYLGAYWLHAVLSACIVCVGFFVGLEKSGWRDRHRLQQLVGFVGIGVAAASFLVYQQYPISNLLAAPRIIDGVVFQTTSYSCAAASIATLSHHLPLDTPVTEADVVDLARTSRMGTSTLAEIHAMKHLGMEPEYRRHLTVEDLIQRNQMAILHVMEPIGTAKIGHAIVLLSIDPEAQILFIANPLLGPVIKPFAGLEGYWLNEAVFATVS